MPKEVENKKPVRKTSTATRSKRVTANKSTRKAPTKSVAKKGSVSSANKFLAAIILAVLLVGGASAFIGLSDKGPINVKSTIEKKAAALEASGKHDEGQAIRTISVPKSSGGPPTDGLVGRGNKETEQQKIEKAAKAAAAPESTASTTDETASSTDEAELETVGDSAEETDESVSEESTELESDSEQPEAEESLEENSAE